MSNYCFDDRETLIDCQPNQLAQINAGFARQRQNILFLKEFLEFIELGQSLFVAEATVEPAAEVGMPVYWNYVTSQFERSKISINVVNDSSVVMPSSEVWGIIKVKTAADRATIILDGLATIDLTASTSDANPQGKFYLTNEAGKMSPAAANLAVPVLLATGDGRCLFRPWFAEQYQRYQISRYVLEADPAGSSSLAGGTWTVTADDTQRGWLPANHASFNGQAPSGFAFGYNIAAHADLAEQWPPSAIDLVRLEWDTGQPEHGGAVSILHGPDARVLIDNSGIWWRSNCDQEVPWYSTVSGSTLGCPKVYPAAMTLYLHQILAGDAVNQTTLRAVGNGLQVTRRGTDQVADRGDLDIKLATAFLMSDVVDNDSHLAVKTQNQSGLLERGTVVTRVTSASDGLTVASSAAGGAGNITLSLTPQTSQLIAPQKIALDGASEESYLDTIGIGLPNGRDACYRAYFYLPPGDQRTSYRLQYEAWYAATVTGRVPELLLTQRVFFPPTPTNGIPETATPLNGGFSAAIIQEGQYSLFRTDEFVAPPEGTVIVTVCRNAKDGDGFAGELHVLKHYLRVTQVDAQAATPNYPPIISGPSVTPAASGIHTEEFTEEFN